MRSGRLRRVIVALWIAMPAAVLAFVWLRTQPGLAALLAAQIIFLVPIAVAAVAAERAYGVGQPGIERRAWGLLAIIACVLLLSEGYFSWYQIAIDPAGPTSASVFDVLNLIAACLMLFTILQLAGVGRLTVPQRARFALDTLAFSAVTFTVLYHFIVAPVAGGASLEEAARWTVYSLVGVLIIMGTLWLVAKARAGVELKLMSLVAVSVGVFATGMLLWPMWRSGDASSAGGLLDGLVGAVYLAGYYLLMMAGLVRLADKDAPWRVTNVTPISTESARVTTVLSLYVLVGSLFIGWWLVVAHGGQPQTTVCVAGVMTAVLALVARTSLAAVETVTTRTEADLDPVTGIGGGMAFVRRFDEALTRASRQTEPISLIVMDMDGFAQVNDALGHSGGDSVLTQVAAALSAAVGNGGETFRLTADEFAVITLVSESHALVIATELLAAIRALPPAGGVPLSASVGVAGCDVGDCRREEMLRRAQAAEAWAKYHGKGRVVRFDARIVRALGVEERLRAHEHRSGMDVARAIISAADARDPRSYYHSRNVAALSVLFAESLGISPEQVRRIEIAAMLHDCGKLGLVDSLLADVLHTSRQQIAAREHAELGGKLTEALGIPHLPDWVRHHHERWDGAGYPDELSGEGVPLESRIIALADAYDAMTSGARNRSPVSRGAALQEIDLGMGSRFDPTLAEQFIEVVGRTASLGWSDEWVVG